jgi:hypothetical protein
MEIGWEVFAAMARCHYKAWSVANQESLDIEYEIDNGIAHFYLLIGRVDAEDKIAVLAYSYDFEINVKKIKIHFGNSSSQTIIIDSSKPNKKAEELLRDTKNLLLKSEAPSFYRNPHCNECHLKESCFAALKQRDCISLLGGMTGKILQSYHKRGIFTILQLSHLFRPRRKNRALSPTGKMLFELKALAIREQKTHVLRKPELPEHLMSVYLDMEGLPDENFIYLIGGIIKQDENIVDQFSYWANNKYEEEAIFFQLFSLLKKFPDASICHYGSYDAKAIRTAAKRNEIEKDELLAIENRMINILSFFRSHVYPPTHTNSLKEIAGYLGFHWSDPVASGLKSISWRKDWELTETDTLKQKLVEYNQDDCKALMVVHEWLKKLAAGSEDNVQEVAAMKRHSPYKYNSNPEYGEEYKVISKAAYFDYQRSKIYWRNGKAAPKDKKQPKHFGKGQPVWQPKKINEIIKIPPLKECPHCGHQKLYFAARQRTFIQTDLKFTPRGIRQWVIEYHSGKGKCAKCRMKYNDSVLRQMRYGDNLLAWAINLYVNYHISFKKISLLLHEQFGIWANPTYFNERMYYWWKRFRPEVDYCMDIIRKCPVIHIDETLVRLTKGKGTGYIWVFATPHTVYYHLTLNRETAFLKEMLKDYQGVIVTDFYGGYEQLQLKRQKCLVHLIRDLNDDLFKNPFDEQFRLLVNAFGKLLKDVVATIDKYGLKKRNLKKHIPQTKVFYENFIAEKKGSELYNKYAKRLKKHWDELWLFLSHDDVPWNNNNAEAAVKAFAHHRRTVNGVVSEGGLKDYLRILTLAQTCRYRNISFLDYARRKAGIWKNIPAELLPGYLPVEQMKLYMQKMNSKTIAECPAFISPEYFQISQNETQKTKRPNAKTRKAHA